MIFGISQYFSNTITKYKAEKLRIVYMGVFYFVGMILLFVLGYTFGLSFLGIKLTLYYMPFYFLEYLYGEFQSRLSEFKFINKKTESIIAISFVVWICIIVRFNLYDISDSVKGILIRAVASLSGCVAIFGVLKNVLASTKNGGANGMVW